MSLAELFVEDDLEISVDPSTYQDQVNPPPPAPGNYRMIVLGGLQQRKDKNGQAVLTDGKFPVLTIQRAKIVEPVEQEKEFGLFHDLRTKPFDRFGTVVSDLGDIIRSMDQTRGWSGLHEGVGLLEELIAQNTPFTVQGAWNAYDGAYVEAQFTALGISKGSEKSALLAGQITKEAYNAIYKAARLGTNDFPIKVNADGVKYRSQVGVGKSGQNLEAKFQIRKFFPSLETVALGPYRIK